jgi:hypothetical protein
VLADLLRGPSRQCPVARPIAEYVRPRSLAIPGGRTAEVTNERPEAGGRHSLPPRSGDVSGYPATFTVSQLRDIYPAALGYQVTATNLQRVLERRGVIETTGTTAMPGGTGGPPAAIHRFRNRDLVVTDPFAALRPPR